jgi:enoyl-CoA hydratase
MGLVNRVVAPDQLLVAAHEMATQIASADQTIVRQMKHLYDLTTRNSLGEALRIEQDTFREFNRQANLGELANAGDAVIERGRTQASQN